ncbi:MAG TPA: GrpB family protein [Desulfosporosinus sp.]|nr:GrpB family protein [Desulfosporosinus sp.]
MLKEELWTLFPIVLSEHRQVWKENYLTEKIVIEQAAGIQNIVRMNHYGSTSVPDLLAKPSIDILIEVNNNTNLKKLILNMQSVGYIYSEQLNNPQPCMMFMKGYTSQGFKGQAFHVHVRYSGHWGELYFRDYLLSHPEIADEYGKLKIELQKKYEYDRDGYTDAKTNFIKQVTKLATTEIQNRY